MKDYKLYTHAFMLAISLNILFRFIGDNFTMGWIGGAVMSCIIIYIIKK